nr:hypothetical protein [Tanacetum cinerariifolium]
QRPRIRGRRPRGAAGRDNVPTRAPHCRARPGQAPREQRRARLTQNRAYHCQAGQRFRDGHHRQRPAHALHLPRLPRRAHAARRGAHHSLPLPHWARLHRERAALRGYAVGREHALPGHARARRNQDAAAEPRPALRARKAARRGQAIFPESRAGWQAGARGARVHFGAGGTQRRLAVCQKEGGIGHAPHPSARCSPGGRVRRLKTRFPYPFPPYRYAMAATQKTIRGDSASPDEQATHQRCVAYWARALAVALPSRG